MAVALSNIYIATSRQTSKSGLEFEALAKYTSGTHAKMMMMTNVYVVLVILNISFMILIKIAFY